MYSDDDLLVLSGIQHMAFCGRPGALIHVEQQWVENVKTTEGNHLHERVDDPLESDNGYCIRLNIKEENKSLMIVVWCRFVPR